MLSFCNNEWTSAPSKEGWYQCICKMSGGEIRTTISSTYLKLLRKSDQQIPLRLYNTFAFQGSRVVAGVLLTISISTDYDLPLPDAFAGPRAGTATVTCQVAFPDTDAITLQEPTVTWFRVRDHWTFRIVNHSTLLSNLILWLLLITITPLQL